MPCLATFQIGELDSVVELFPVAVLAFMVEDALYDDDVSGLKKLLSASTIAIMESSTDLLGVCGEQEGEDHRQGCQWRLAHCLWSSSS